MLGAVAFSYHGNKPDVNSNSTTMNVLLMNAWLVIRRTQTVIIHDVYMISRWEGFPVLL